MASITAKEYQKRRRKAGIDALEQIFAKYVTYRPSRAQCGRIVDAVLLACDKEEDKICDELMEKVNKK